MSQMNLQKRQLLIQLNNSAIKAQAGEMQWISGAVQASSGVTGVGNFLGKMVKGAVTGESAVKTVYQGQGFVMCEPTYNYIIIEDLANWPGGITLDDGLFLACDANITENIRRERTFLLHFLVERVSSTLVFMDRALRHLRHQFQEKNYLNLCWTMTL